MRNKGSLLLIALSIVVGYLLGSTIDTASAIGFGIIFGGVAATLLGLFGKLN